MSCGGRDLDDEEDGSLVCLHCGHVSEKIVAEPFARSMALGDRGWMITESSSKQTYKATEMLERMAEILSLPDGKSKAQQALRVMCEYESGCRARSAAWSVRRRLCYAGLAIALKALDDMVEEEHMSTADDELSQLADRVRMRLQRQRERGGRCGQQQRWIQEEHRCVCLQSVCLFDIQDGSKD